MGLIFHDGTNAVLSGYASQKWNDATLLGNVGAFSSYNSEIGIAKILDNPKSKTTFKTQVMIGKKPTDLTIDFREIKKHVGEPNAFVVKGVHQVGAGIIATPHISIAFEGFIYHMEMLNDKKAGLVIFNITRGQEYEDAEGFTKV